MTFERHSYFYTREKLATQNFRMALYLENLKTDPFTLDGEQLKIDELVAPLLANNSIDAGVPTPEQDAVLNTCDKNVILWNIQTILDFQQNQQKAQEAWDDPDETLIKDIKKLISKARATLRGPKPDPSKKDDLLLPQADQAIIVKKFFDENKSKRSIYLSTKYTKWQVDQTIKSFTEKGTFARRENSRRIFRAPPLEEVKAKAINYYMAYGNLGKTICGFSDYMKKKFEGEMGTFCDRTIQQYLKKSLGLKKSKPYRKSTKVDVLKMLVCSVSFSAITC